MKAYLGFNFLIIDTLQELQLNNNHIITVESEFLNSLNALKKLDLSSNKISTFTAMEGMANIQELLLDNNLITYLEPDAVVGLLMCTYLTFDDNPLSAATTELIIPVNISTLRIQVVEIQTLTIRCASPHNCSINTLYLKSGFNHTPVINDIKNTLHFYRLQGIDGANIPIEGLRSDAFTNMYALGILLLREVLFNPFPSISNISSLRVLNLKQLRLSNEDVFLPADGLESMTFIEDIVLSNNNLTRFPDFSRFIDMSILDLSNNAIAYLPGDVLLQMSSLEILKLNGNPITNIVEFPYKEISMLRNLEIR